MDNNRYAFYRTAIFRLRATPKFKILADCNCQLEAQSVNFLFFCNFSSIKRIFFCIFMLHIMYKYNNFA